MKRIEAVLDSHHTRKGERHRRGLRRQRRRRDAERIVRVSALVYLRWAKLQGQSLRQAALALGIDPSTLRSWDKRWREDRLRAKQRGRPSDPLEREELLSFLAVFGLIGPQVSLATLQSFLPDLPRSALIGLLERCRTIYRRKRAWVVHALRWTRAGSVWAMDFATPPQPIDGIYPKLFLVRDLPSGVVLIALPCLEESSAIVVRVLASLFRWFGAPLVLKNDNGSPFVTDEVKALLEQHGVLQLCSPPGTPSYNGSVEAGIGSIKVRAFWQAARHERAPGEWTCDDIEAARAEANECGSPRAATGSSPNDAWTWRLPITPEQRRTFQDACTQHAREEYTRRGMLPMALLQHHEQAALDRVAITRALVDQGFLLIRRKRIAPPISSFRLRKIS